MMLNMSKDFAKSAESLPKEIRAKLPKVFLLLISDPKHPSLQVKKIQGAKRKDIYECRVDQSYRMIIRDLGEMKYDLVAIGEHDKTLSLGMSVGAGVTAGLAAIGGISGELNMRPGRIVGSLLWIMKKTGRIKENEVSRLLSWLDGNDGALEFSPVDTTVFLT